MGKEHAATDQANLPSGSGGGVFSFFRDAWQGVQVGRMMRRESRAATSDLVNPQDWFLQALGGALTKSGASVNEHTALAVATVRTCVNLRSDLIAMLPLKVYRKTERGSIEQPDHPLARLFRGKVAPGFTSFKWRKCVQTCFDLGGNGYTRIYRNAYAEPERLRWLKPADVLPLENRQTGAVGWRVNGQGVLFEHDVLHVANLSTNGRTGRSPIQDLRETVGLSLTAEEAAARSFSNGNRRPGVIVGRENYTKEKAEVFLAYWMQHYGGAANTGKVPFVWGGVDWKEAGFSNQDAELLLTRKFTKEEIASIFQIPLHLVNSTEKSTAGYGANVAEVNQGLVDYMLQPLCENWEAEMDSTLLTERELDERFFIKFSVDALLRGSPETRAKVYQIMRGIAAMSVNEVRSLEDLPRLEKPDGIFDDARLPLNNQGGGGAQPFKQPIANPAAGDPSARSAAAAPAPVNVDVQVHVERDDSPRETEITRSASGALVARSRPVSPASKV